MKKLIKRPVIRAIALILAALMLLMSGISVSAGTETPIVKPKPIIKEVSLVLSGEIGLVFHFYVPASYEAGYVRLCKTDGEREYDIVNKTIAECDSTDNRHNYSAAYYLSALELSEKIYIEIFSEDNDLLAKNSFSAESYIRTVLDESFTGATEKEKEIARTLLNYGHYAQLACAGENGWIVGEDFPETKAYDSLKSDKSVFDEYGIEWSTDTEEFNRLYMSLFLDYKTRIHLYIPTEEEPSVTVENLTETQRTNNPVVKEYLTGISGRIKDTLTYEICIDGVNALNLTDKYKITVNGVEVILSAFSYCRLAAQYDTEGNTIDAMIALYEFSCAAQNYLNSNAEAEQ